MVVLNKLFSITIKLCASHSVLWISQRISQWIRSLLNTYIYLNHFGKLMSLWGDCLATYWPTFLKQGQSEGTSSVAFEVLIINCQIYFKNSLIFICLTLNIKLLIFKLFGVKFLFSEKHVFRTQKRTAVYGVMDARL